jgi:hypothetical protein
MARVEVSPGIWVSERSLLIAEDAYRAVDLNPGKYMVINQGSWSQGSLSGSTHNGGGAFDLRTWNLPSHKVGPLVVELRRRNGCAWKRDKDHGGFDPHIHCIVRDEPNLSRGAQWQVDEYDRTNNGLTDRGADYHPRPKQYPIEHFTNPTPQPGTPGKAGESLEDDDMFIFKAHENGKPAGQGIGTGAAWIVHNGFAVQCSGDYGAEGCAIIKSSSEEMDAAFFSTVQRKAL